MRRHPSALLRSAPLVFAQVVRQNCRIMQKSLPSIERQGFLFKGEL
ncbi:hypothetical protein HMPREF1153_2204 [Selenomonas sp. CM52]|nr:hypothetical protein HMPREF1153_2204 [Selenomonas sp. CM52]